MAKEKGKGCVSVLPPFDPRLIESSREADGSDCVVCVCVFVCACVCVRERERRPRSVSPALNLTFLRESEKLPRAFAKAARSHGIAILDAADCRRKRPTSTTLGLSISFYLVLSPPLSYLPAACTSVTLLRPPHRIDARRDTDPDVALPKPFTDTTARHRRVLPTSGR